MESEPTDTSKPARELMIVGSPSPPTETEDHYMTQDHIRMDQEVEAKLAEERTQWRENPSRPELRFVLCAVVQSDPRLDRKYLDLDIAFPDKLETKLSDAWRAMSFRSVRILRYLQTHAETLRQSELALGEAMTHDYEGDSVDAFIHNLAFHSHNNTKFCSIAQSSGMGKTRLLFELGKKGICVLYINIRSEKDEGYPPRDTIPANLLTKFFPTRELYHHCCQIFFATIFKCLAKFLREESNPFGVLSNVDNRRRTKFFEDVEKEFPNVEQESLSSNVMCVYFEEMVHTAPLSRSNKNEPKVVIALDEAHVLHEKSMNQDYLPATVLLQTIKEYSDVFKLEPVWVVFASTMSKFFCCLFTMAISAPSAAVALEGELFFPPFTQLGWDQHTPVLEDVELDKVAWGSHLLQYGCPLWWSHRGYRPLPKIVDLAAQKLCASVTFHPKSHHQAFAVLGQRFGLNIAFGGHRQAVQYNDTFIASHLRVCIKTTDDQMWNYTTYPSEPIVSAAAADLLYEEEENLTDALKAVSRMVNNSLINVGDPGELSSRFLWLLGKDFCVRKGFGQQSAPPATNNGVHGDYELPYCRPVPVIEFLKLAFGPHILDNAPDTRKVFEDAYINFSHWVQMKFDITRGDGRNDVSIEEWTESLWARTSAIQCCRNQPLINKFIPMYFKSRPRETAMSHILISNKARDSAEPVILDKITRDHENIAPCYRGPPYIAILADLGLSSSDSCDVVVHDKSTTDDPCLRIYAPGLNKKTYPFLPNEIAGILNELYRQPLPSRPTLLQDLEAKVDLDSPRRHAI